MLQDAWARLRRSTNETPFEVSFALLSVYLGVSTLVLDHIDPIVPRPLMWATMGTVALGGAVTFIARLWREDLLQLERAGVACLAVAYACFATYILARIGVSFMTVQSVMPDYVVAYIFAHRFRTLGKALGIVKRMSR